MRVETALNHRRRLETRLRDIFSMARAYSMTHQQMLHDLQKYVYQDPGYKRCPTWVHVHLRAVTNVYFELLYQQPQPDNEVVWQHYENGERVAREDVKEWSRVTGRHEWSKTGKPFSCP